MGDTQNTAGDPWFGTVDGQWYWLDVPSKTTVTGAWTLLVLDTGFKILTFGDSYAAGASVHILRPDNSEVQRWESAEWEIEGEGELVVGAVLRAAGGH